METGGHLGGSVCAAVDVHYLSTGGARAAAVLAADAAFAHPLAEHTAMTARVPAYRPGEFYLRELPPLRAVLDDLSGLSLLVVDGYADLDPSGRPGLGAHAHAEFGIPVIGVAKSRFPTATHAVPINRGSSVRPLFVTAAGMPAADAASLVRRMTGRYRLPDALRRADHLARADPPTATTTGRQPGRPGGKEGGGDRAGQCPEFSIVVASTLTALSSAGERTSHGMMAISSGRYVLASIALAAARAMTTTTGPWTAAATAAPPSSSARIPVATRSSSSRRTW
jgi:deoxyribonuclease V